MRRATVNFIIDAIAFLAFVCLTVTGLLLKYAPRGRGAGPHGSGDWLGVSHEVWSDIHFVASILFVVLILIHILLHWNWIAGCTRSLFARTPCPPAEGSRLKQGE